MDSHTTSVNLKTIAAKAVTAAFQVADSLLATCSYRQAGTVSYDASTGAVTPSNTLTTIRALFTRYEAKESDSPSMRTGERVALVKWSELPSLVPSEGDTIIEGSTLWEVVGIREDKTDALWSFVVKRGQS